MKESAKGRFFEKGRKVATNVTWTLYEEDVMMWEGCRKYTDFTSRQSEQLHAAGQKWSEMQWSVILLDL